MYCTHQLLMIEPVSFGFNNQTAVNNSFQQETSSDVQANALAEFRAFIEILKARKIDVTVIQDSPIPHTPDSIFPNNWISFHEDNSIVLYPMFAENRRQERKQHILDVLEQKFIISNKYNLTHWENSSLYLEGTGSMVFDRDHKIAYAALSPRTSEEVLKAFCGIMNYTAVIFHAVDKNGIPVYHTNVLMCVATQFAVVCLDVIGDMQEREMLIKKLSETGKEIIAITISQMENFAGNMLQLKNTDGELLLVMSSRAYHSLTQQQITLLEKYNRIIHVPLDTIERCGGGSARCMMAEIFNERI